MANPYSLDPDEPRFPHEVTINVGKLRSYLRPSAGKRASVADRIEAQYTWCCDADRPGQFARDSMMDGDNLLLVYSFSDPDTAFEFRMRFG